MIIIKTSIYFVICLQLQTFQKDHPDIGGGNQALQQAIEMTQANMKWMERNEKKITDWLKEVVTTS